MIKVLIVDDEPLARRGVRVCLRRAPDVQVVGEAECGDEAIEKINELRPDLIFLDIQMPGLDGFQTLSRLDPAKTPAVVFLTAYDEYALAAFSVHALDYVMKPIDDQRFDEALDTARKRLSDRRAGEQLAGIRDLLIERADATARTWQDRFVIKNGSRTLWVTADEIDWIEASGDYAILHVGPRRHMIHDTMDGLEQRLDPKKFARIHRSTIVALDRLKGFGLLPTRDAIVTLKDGSELRVSRRYRHRLPFGREG